MPKYGERGTCSRCTQDVEWVGFWQDRGGNRGCVPFYEKGELVVPTKGVHRVGSWFANQPKEAQDAIRQTSKRLAGELFVKVETGA
jgi:hypothetical protein